MLGNSLLDSDSKKGLEMRITWKVDLIFSLKSLILLSMYK